MANRPMRRTALVAFSVALALVGAACSSNSGSTGGGEGNESGTTSTVNATMKDFSITLGSTSVTSGEVEFDITNDGPSEHEFVVLETDVAADALPVANGEATEDADGITNVGEAEDIASGSAATLTLTLQPGNYVVICNLPGHYQKGMHAAFTVA